MKTKHISLEEAQKLATKGELTIGTENKRSLHGGFRGGTIADCYSGYLQKGEERGNKAEMNAALIAHHWNTYMELVNFVRRFEWDKPRPP